LGQSEGEARRGREETNVSEEKGPPRKGEDPTSLEGNPTAETRREAEAKLSDTISSQGNVSGSQERGKIPLQRDSPGEAAMELGVGGGGAH